MKRVLVTFGGRAYDETTAITVRDAPRFGVDQVMVYDDKWLMTTPWWAEHHAMVKASTHGFGWCTWKPYVITDALIGLQAGDLLLYVDADTYPIADLTPLFDMAARDGIVLFEEQGCINERWTRRDLFDAMGIDYGRRSETIACGRFQVFQRWSAPTEKVLTEWNIWSTDIDAIGWGASVKSADHSNFARHSTEQSVLSLLAIKYGIPRHRTPCQNGWPASPGCGQAEDTYPQLFHQQYCEGDRRNHSGSRFRTV